MALWARRTNKGRHSYHSSMHSMCQSYQTAQAPHSRLAACRHYVSGSTRWCSGFSRQPNMSLVHPGSELPTLPDVLDNESDSDLSSFTGTLVRLGDAAGKTPAVRDQLVADGVLVRIVQLLRQRSEWLLRISVSVGSSNEHGRGIDVLSQCLRVCGNSCIDCNSARDALLQHAALPAILACLRCTTRVDVVKFAAGALSNLICAHEAAQEALMHNNATAVIVPALNHAMSVSALPS